MILVLALALLTLLLVVGMTLLGVGQTETQVADRNLQMVQALHVADAMVDTVRLELNRRLDSNATKADLDEELANNGYLRNGTDFRWGSSASTLGSESINGQAFAVRVHLENNNDGGTATDDRDRTVWVVAMAEHVVRGHKVTRQVRALIGPSGLSAFMMGCTPGGGDTLSISGSVSVEGSVGSVHSNCNLDVDGNSASFTANVTAVGTLTIDHPERVAGVRDDTANFLPLPEVRPSDFKDKADYILTGDGRVLQKDISGAWVAIYNAASGGDWHKWTWSDKGSGVAEWQLSGTGNNVDAEIENRMLYFEKASSGTVGNARCDARLASSPGTESNPWKVSIVAEGHIDVQGSPKLQAADGKDNLLLIAATDIQVSGSMGATFQAGGVVAAHEQIGITGNMTVTGFFMAENAASSDGLVGATSISGNTTITYSGAPSPPGSWKFPLRVLAWKQEQ